MARNVINRSISFDPEVFAKLELRREELLMDRSGYVVSLILKDLREGGTLERVAMPHGFVKKPVVMTDRSRPKKKKR